MAKNFTKSQVQWLVSTRIDMKGTFKAAKKGHTKLWAQTADELQEKLSLPEKKFGIQFYQNHLIQKYRKTTVRIGRTGGTGETKEFFEELNLVYRDRGNICYQQKMSIAGSQGESGAPVTNLPDIGDDDSEPADNSETADDSSGEIEATPVNELRLMDAGLSDEEVTQVQKRGKGSPPARKRRTQAEVVVDASKDIARQQQAHTAMMVDKLTIFMDERTEVSERRASALEALVEHQRKYLPLKMHQHHIEFEDTPADP